MALFLHGMASNTIPLTPVRVWVECRVVPVRVALCGLGL